MTPTEYRFSVEVLARRFQFVAGAGLFSADRLDDGTRLLLEHLPSAAPRTVLDLGCGYGGLGLPIAAAYPEASLLLVDRDLLAVEYAARNAKALGLANVDCRGSLGYRDLGTGAFDWVLCNVPARIGRNAIAAFATGGCARLAPGGELRVVVIRDLGPIVEEVLATEKLEGGLVAEGPRHLIYRMAPKAGPLSEDEAIYVRDSVTVGDLSLERPADISEDPSHLRDGLPLLLSCLPTRPTGRALVWRGSYGAVAATLARRGASVVAADRDLLALAFTQRNARRLGLALDVRPAARAQALAGEGFDSVVAEAQPALGEAGVREEWKALAALIGKGREGLLLCPSRLAKGLLRSVANEGHTLLADHKGWIVVRLRPPRR